MGIDERHQGQKPVVGNAENTDLAIAFRDVLHQPVDGVVSVGCMVDRGRVPRPAQRTIHDVVALRSVLAAYILDHPNVAAFDNDVGGIVVSIEIWTEVSAVGVAGEFSSVV